MITSLGHEREVRGLMSMWFKREGDRYTKERIAVVLATEMYDDARNMTRAKKEDVNIQHVPDKKFPPTSLTALRSLLEGDCLTMQISFAQMNK